MVEDTTLLATLAVVLSTGITGAIVRSSKRTPRPTHRDDLKAVQAAHSRPTSRLGGLGVFTGFGAAAILMASLADDITPIFLVTSALPIFLAGLLEDMGKDQSPPRRLLAATVSAALAIMITQTWIKETGLGGLDLLLSGLPIGLGITALWSAGVCNAFNLIDGVNGLAGALAFSTAVALGYIAWSAGDILMAQAAIVLAVSVIGFLVFNWPGGNIFLGDAGAYTVGHLLVWISVLIAERNQEYSYAAISLLFFWPVADTFLAMWRRSRRKARMMHPDYLHVHQFVMRAIQMRWKVSLAWANSATTLALLPLFTIPILTGVVTLHDPYMALVAWFLCGAVFVYLYLVGIQHVRRQTWRVARSRRGKHHVLNHPTEKKRQPRVQ